MAKNIIFCADGTWNGPDQDEDGDRQPDPTNVYKLFLALDGALDYELRDADEQEKRLVVGAQTVQVAKYLHGVGDSRNPITKIFGGAFGAGIISRIVRGYTFISRNYQAGDRIVLVGFSRGAYTARALGGLICSQGLLRPQLTADKTTAYRWGAKAWYRYRRQSQRQGVLQRLAEVCADLPAFLSSDELTENDLIAEVPITAIAVWDTVGAMGIPHYVKDARIDAFKFADTTLHPRVERGLHAISLDERRGDFGPTLWDRRAGITQRVFPGAHADVGGGYPTANHESELSDLALRWLANELTAIEVPLTLPTFQPFMPAVTGTAHEPWRHPPFNLPGLELNSRDFGPEVVAASGIVEHEAVQGRIDSQPVVPEPGTAPAPYRPANRPWQPTGD